MIFIIAIITAIFWHVSLHKLWTATVGSTLTATIITWALLARHFGANDSTFYINLSLTLIISSVISLIVGVIVTALCNKYQKAER